MFNRDRSSVKSNVRPTRSYTAWSKRALDANKPHRNWTCPRYEWIAGQRLVKFFLKENIRKGFARAHRPCQRSRAVLARGNQDTENSSNCGHPCATVRVSRPKKVCSIAR